MRRFPRSGRVELEVLDRVGDVHPVPVDAHGNQCLVEQLARGSDEWQARAVLLVAGLLADEHDLGG